MKHAKRFAAVLLAVMLMAALIVLPAQAVEYATLNLSTVTAAGLDLKEAFEVTEAGVHNPTVTYTLTLGDVTVYTSGGVTYGDADDPGASLNGRELANLTIAAGAVTGNSTTTFDYNVNTTTLAAIQALTFTKPGIYYWTITKEKTSADTHVTNHNRSASSNTGTALLIRVDDNGHGVLVPTVGIAVTETEGGLPGTNKNSTYEDNYPAKAGTLTLKKEVTGNQGAKDQYFKFVVELSGLTAHPGVNLNLDVTNGNSVATATAKKYDKETFTPGTTNNDQIVIVDADGTATATFWLKDQEEIQFTNLPVGSNTITYTITEYDSNGYTTTYTVEGGNTVASTSGTSVTQDMAASGEGDRVVFKNDKASSVPTGVTLQTAAPIAGVVIVAALAAVVLLSKKRRESYTA